MSAKVAIIGSGNIGTDLMIKILRMSETLEMGAMVGIDADSDGLARARRLNVETTARGVEGLLALDVFPEIEIVFDATSAAAHRQNDRMLRDHNVTVVDLTPAAIGPYVVPVVNLDAHAGERNLSMVTCGGQATIPIVAAIAEVSPVVYGEIIASIASKSAGPGTRSNIDEFTETTARGVQEVGGALNGKAVIILNPAEPPLLMRDTVCCLVQETADTDAIQASVIDMVERVRDYVPGYRLKQAVQFERFGADAPLDAPAIGFRGAGLKVTVLLEVEGAGQYLPAYAGNLDIMTSAAQRTAERMIQSIGTTR